MRNEYYENIITEILHILSLRKAGVIKYDTTVVSEINDIFRSKWTDYLNPYT